MTTITITERDDEWFQDEYYADLDREAGQTMEGIMDMAFPGSELDDYLARKMSREDA